MGTLFSDLSEANKEQIRRECDRIARLMDRARIPPRNIALPVSVSDTLPLSPEDMQLLKEDALMQEFMLLAKLADEEKDRFNYSIPPFLERFRPQIREIEKKSWEDYKKMMREIAKIIEVIKRESQKSKYGWKWYWTGYQCCDQSADLAEAINGLKSKYWFAKIIGGKTRTFRLQHHVVNFFYTKNKDKIHFILDPLNNDFWGKKYKNESAFRKEYPVPTIH